MIKVKCVFIQQMNSKLGGPYIRNLTSQLNELLDLEPLTISLQLCKKYSYVYFDF